MLRAFSSTLPATSKEFLYESKLAVTDCFLEENHVQQNAEMFNKRKGTATMHGQMYEVKMCTLLFLKLINIGAEFYLCSNLKEGGDFDDVVVHYRYTKQNDEVESKALFIQLKHAEKKNTTRSVSFLEGYFNLNKYFLSFCRIHSNIDQKHKILCSNPDNREYLIFTNAGVNTGMHFLIEIIEQSDLISEITKEGKVYRVQESKTKEYLEFINIVKEKSTSKINTGNQSTKQCITDIIGMDEYKNNLYLQKFVEKVKRNNMEIESINEHKYSTVDMFKKFISLAKICCKQVDESNLEKLIKIEIEKSVSVSRKETENICSKLLETIKYWWETDSHYLTNKSSFWDDIVKETELSLFREKEDQLLNLGIQFCEEALQEIQVEVVQSTSVLNIMYSGKSSTITSLKILQALISKGDRDYIMVDMETLIEKSDKIFQAWSKRWCNILVVECIANYERSEWPFQRICEILERQTEARLILISPRTSLLKKCFSETSFKNEYREYVDVSGANQLDSGSLNKLLAKEITFQGQHVKLSNILNSFDVTRINSDGLACLLENKCALLGKSIQACNIENYITRSIRIPVIDNSIFRSNNNIILALEVQEDQELNTLNIKNVHTMNDVWSLCSLDGPTCFIMEKGAERDNFETLCRKFENVNWLKRYEDKHVWKRWKGSNVLKDFLRSSELPVSVNEEYLVNDELQSPVVIIGESGMGKTTLLGQMAVSLKQKYPYNWVILVDLSKHCEYLSKINYIKEENVIRILENSLSFNDDELCFFNLAQNNLKNYYSKKFIVLFDAFDEISPIYTEKVRDIIRCLIVSSCHVYVTSRASYATYLEHEFSTYSHHLAQFDNVSKELYLLNTLKITDTKREQDMEGELKNIIEEYSLLCDKNNTFTENPLHLKMLAETFSDFVQNDRNSSDSKFFLNIFNVYTYYIRRKCELFFREKKKTDIFNPNIKDELDVFITNFTEANKLISASLYITEMGKEYCIKSFREIIKNQFSISENDLIKTGILNNISDTYANYIHRSFAEYFFALYVADVCKNNKKVIEKIFFNKEYDVVKRFFDLKCADKCELLTDVILSGTAIAHQPIFPDKILKSVDTIGRQAIHLAADYNKSDTLKVLVKVVSDLLTKDSIGWTPIDYALVSGSWESLDNMLNIIAMFKKENRGFFQNITNKIRFTRIHIKIWKFIKDKKEYLFYICCSRGLNQLVTFIEKHININVPFHFKYSTDSSARNEKLLFYSRTLYPLHVAIIAKNIEIVKQLIEHKCYVNVQASQGIFYKAPSALTIASVEGHTDIVKLLIENGADVNAVSGHKSTALHYACRYDQNEVVKVLIQNGSDINSENSSGMTPFHYAYKYGSAELIKTITGNDCPIDCSNRSQEVDVWDHDFHIM